MASKSLDVERNAGPRKNESLERESRGWTGLVIYSSLFISLDLWKQISSYGIKYYNNDHYALPQTAVVGITEVLKLLLSLGMLIYTRTLREVTYTWLFAVPSLIYAINNNVYMFALHYTTPPVWNILIQQRIIFTAFVYRFWFKRNITNTQWAALVMLISAIVLTNASEGKSAAGSRNLFISILLATGGSMLSTLGTVYTEYLMKNNKRSFAEMQLQLYTYGTISCVILYAMEMGSTKTPDVQEWERPQLILFLLVTCVLLSGTAGISTAIIVKKLDNIVKLYTQALSNMLTSLACAFFFPNKFSISPLFVFCIILVFIAIVMYERKTVDYRYIMLVVTSRTGSVLPVIFVALFLLVLIWQLFPGVDSLPVSNLLVKGNFTTMTPV